MHKDIESDRNGAQLAAVNLAALLDGVAEHALRASKALRQYSAGKMSWEVLVVHLAHVDWGAVGTAMGMSVGGQRGQEKDGVAGG